VVLVCGSDGSKESRHCAGKMDVPTRTQDRTPSQVVAKIIESEGNWDQNDDSNDSQFKDAQVDLLPSSSGINAGESLFVGKEARPSGRELCFIKLTFRLYRVAKCRTTETSIQQKQTRLVVLKFTLQNENIKNIKRNKEILQK
jgi:hypothetical protein